MKSKETSIDNEDVEVAIRCASDILDKASDNKKEEAIGIIGQDNLNTFKEKNN